MSTVGFVVAEKLLALLLELFNLTGDTNLLSLIDLLKKSLDDSVKKEKADKKDEKAYTEVDRSNENARFRNHSLRLWVLWNPNVVYFIWGN